MPSKIRSQSLLRPDCFYSEALGDKLARPLFVERGQSRASARNRAYKIWFGANGYYLKQITNPSVNGMQVTDSPEQVGAIGPGAMWDLGHFNRKRLTKPICSGDALRAELAT